MVSLGGSIFAHNALKYDYCIKEAIDSLLDLCDEVVMLDAESDDGTFELFKEIESKNEKARVIASKWEQHIEGQPLYDRLCILANVSRMNLTTDWHFMLQADEVLHEDSIPIIRNAIQNNKLNSVMCHRVNLWGGMGTCVKTNSSMRPCGDYIVRLAKKEVEVVGDAESLRHAAPCNHDLSNSILIYHYGMVRNPYIFVDKVIDMQKWFFENNVDHRYLKYKEDGERFNPFDGQFMPKSELTKIPKPHPKYAEKWVAKRAPFYK